MFILGLNHDLYISSAALIEDGRICAAAAEERFTREKHTRDFPRHAVGFCLNAAGISMGEVDHVATAWNPGAYMIKRNPLVSEHRRFKSEYLYSVPDNLLDLYPESEREVDHVHQRFVLGGSECSVFHVTHHRAHAANAFLISPFEEAAIMTADSQGEFESTTFGVGRGNRIEISGRINHPHSLGAFYATFTDYLGFRPNRDEWKVMALAACAKGDAAALGQTVRDEMVTTREDGGFSLNLAYFGDFLHERPHHYTALTEGLLGPARRPEEPLEDRHYLIAAAMQKVAEEVTFNALRALHGRTRLDALCVSGGFFMNSVINGKILSETPFRELFVSPCPDDSGNSMGAALYLYNHILDQPERQPLRHNFFGPSFDDDEIEKTLAASGLRARRSDDVENETAAALADGKLVGWFQGAMEFGQRALGNRSILADPRDPAIRDRINAAIKFRESFRPFAPAVPAEAAAEYFEIEPGGAIPFMERVVPVRPEKRGIIPGVVHYDGSARVQTVSADTSPAFHRLISLFAEKTGVPVLLNTSFNLNGEPIVMSPNDAIRTFATCGLDLLVMGNYMLDKNGEHQ